MPMSRGSRSVPPSLIDTPGMRELLTIEPGLEVVASLPGDWDRGKAANITNGILTKHPDLVAIATVTDMVPMIGENRVLEVYGLKVLNKTRQIGRAHV